MKFITFVITVFISATAFSASINCKLSINGQAPLPYEPVPVEKAYHNVIGGDGLDSQVRITFSPNINGMGGILVLEKQINGGGFHTSVMSPMLPGIDNVYTEHTQDDKMRSDITCLLTN